MKEILYFYYDVKIRRTVLIRNDGKSYADAKTPVFLLQRACLKCGTSLEGTKASFHYLTGAKKRIPICVSVLMRIVFIPLKDEEKNLIYVQYDRIERIRSINKQSQIFFRSGETLTISSSIRTIRRQMERCALFLEQVYAYKEDFREEEYG